MRRRRQALDSEALSIHFIPASTSGYESGVFIFAHCCWFMATFYLIPQC